MSGVLFQWRLCKTDVLLNFLLLLPILICLVIKDAAVPQKAIKLFFTIKDAIIFKINLP